MAYSMDLRERVLGECDAGLGPRRLVFINQTWAKTNMTRLG